MKNLFTVKSSDCRDLLSKLQTSSAYNKIGKHNSDCWFGSFYYVMWLAKCQNLGKIGKIGPTSWARDANSRDIETETRSLPIGTFCTIWMHATVVALRHSAECLQDGESSQRARWLAARQQDVCEVRSVHDAARRMSIGFVRDRHDRMSILTVSSMGK